MMEEINKKINDALGSIDDLPRASAPDYFFTRLEGRMLREKNSWERISSFISRPAIAIASVSIILIMNFYTIFYTSQHEEGTVTQSTELAAVDEYSQVSSGIYEFENNNP